MVRNQYTLELPMKSVGASIQQYLPAAVGRTVSHNTGICAVGLLPHLRIAKIISAAALRDILFIQNRVLLIFLIINPVAYGNALCLNFPVNITSLMFL